MFRLIISVDLLNKVVLECLNTRIEKVYIGIGSKDKDNFVVSQLHECSNVSKTPDRTFVADPLCIINLYEKAKALGMDIVALLHSHPAPPTPSLDDLKGMEAWKIPWIIVNSLDGERNAWILIDNTLMEIPIVETKQ
ncbi:MAG: Mov34/MPN/PAD-1 family protein [Desulfurococcaceae archaeon]